MIVDGKKGIIIFILLFLIFSSISLVNAHQPRLDLGSAATIENAIIVKNPEISQAFYGQLNGKPVYYKITSDKPFELYVGLLVPTSPGLSGEFVSAEVRDSSGKVIMFLNGTKEKWEPYFEEFGGDYYLKGPEATLNVPAGTYYVKVFNAKNQGKYSLAIGKIEAFPADEAITALFTLPLLKEQFFGKPIINLFFQFLGIIIALGSTLTLLFMSIKSRKSEETAQITQKVSLIIKPVIWLGIVITLIVWGYVMYKNPLNILGLVNSLILILIIIITWYLGSKFPKMGFGNLPLKTLLIVTILWWVYVFLSISVI